MSDATVYDEFQTQRPRLFGIAYRMLGTRADATVVTRLAIDRLRAARVEREAYTGDWRPEPIVEWNLETPEAIVERGGERVTNLFWAQYLRLGPRVQYRMVAINGEPGLLRYMDGRLVAMYAVRNPDKLASIAQGN